MARYRLPFAPLARLVLLESDDPDAGNSYIAMRLQSPRRSVERWHDRGVDVWFADKLCTAVGLEPSLVWGDEYEQAVDAECFAKLGCADCGDWLCLCAAATDEPTDAGVEQLTFELERAS